jgi:NADPH-dependent glutamate synthase beta subunit-like oxidoreductase
LSAAYDLIRQGYAVTVYEAASSAGGMLTAGIPTFILPREIINAEITMIKALGVEIKTNLPIGKAMSLEELWKLGFKAILLATGAHKSIPLPIPGADLNDIHNALPLLKKVNSGGKIPFRGKVVVIGGGAVAMDGARMVKRLGADEVHVACLESRRDMPAYPWLIEAAEKEGAKIHASLAPQKFTARARQDGKNGIFVEFQRVASTRVDEEGRISWTLMEGPGCKYDMEADSVILAIGQAPDSSYAEKTGVKISGRGTFAVKADTLATDVPGVFAAGDAVSLRGTVIEAIAAGQKAARSIHSYLQGRDLAANPPGKEVLKIDPELTASWLIRKSRWGMPSLSSKDSIRTFDEVELGYTRAAAIEEAKRCLNCRMCVNCLYGRSQVCFETGQRLL